MIPDLCFFFSRPADQRAEQENIAELSPGAVGAGGAGAGGGGGGGARADHQAAINSMMMERMNTDIYALKKQYARIKRRQQQQAMQLYIRTGGRKYSNITVTLDMLCCHVSTVAHCGWLPSATTPPDVTKSHTPFSSTPCRQKGPAQTLHL